MAFFDEHLWAHLVEEHGADKVVLQTPKSGRRRQAIIISAVVLAAATLVVVLLVLTVR